MSEKLGRKSGSNEQQAVAMTIRSSGMLGGREGCRFSSATPKAICERGSRGGGMAMGGGGPG